MYLYFNIFNVILIDLEIFNVKVYFFWGDNILYKGLFYIVDLILVILINL